MYNFSKHDNHKNYYMALKRRTVKLYWLTCFTH